MFILRLTRQSSGLIPNREIGKHNFYLYVRETASFCTRSVEQRSAKITSGYWQYRDNVSNSLRSCSLLIRNVSQIYRPKESTVSAENKYKGDIYGLR